MCEEEEHALREPEDCCFVYGQCTGALRAKVEAQPGLSDSAEASDVIALLKSIKTVMFSFQAQKYAPQALCEAKRRFYSMRQGKDRTCQQYLETYQDCIDVITFCGGEIGTNNGLVDNNLRPLMHANATAAQLAAANIFSKIAVGFILGADPARYGKVIEDLENDHTQKQDQFPKTLDEAYSLLVHWKQNPRNIARGLGSSNDGMSFTNVGEDADDGGAKSHQTSKSAWKKGQARGTTPLEFITCFRCDKKGHYANECPNANATTATGHTQACGETGVQLLMVGANNDDYCKDNTAFSFVNTTAHILHQMNGKLPQNWILLDNQSTVNVFSSGKLLTNIRKASTTMTISFNAGKTTTNLVGDLKGYPDAVWFNPTGIVNILSLSELERHYKVTYNSDAKKLFVVHKDDSTQQSFQQSKMGLFYMDVGKIDDEIVLVNTVAENKMSYTNRHYKNAVAARKLQNTIGRPSLQAS